MQQHLIGAIEAGGTKFHCLLARVAGEHVLDTLAEVRIATTTPQETLPQVVDFFTAGQQRYGRIAAFGIGAFGPVDVHDASPTYGHILKTPKAGWSGTSMIAPLQGFDAPIVIDTDVNVAALAEYRFGAGQGVQSLAYVTVGTGIGGGVVHGGRTIKGALHPEMGHINVRRHVHDARFAGTCPFHGDCLEGMASGPAIMARYGVSLDRLPDDHPALCVIGDYLGQLAGTIMLMHSVQRVVFGGGVMQRPGLMPHVRAGVRNMLRGYLPMEHDEWLEQLLVLPGLGDQAGRRGAILLAHDVLMSK